MHPPHTLTLAGELTIFTAAPLREQLLSTLADLPPEQELELDLAQVSEIDSAGLQLLLAAKQSAQAQSRNLRLSRHSAAVLDLLDLCDLASHFGDPLILPSHHPERP